MVRLLTAKVCLAFGLFVTIGLTLSDQDWANFTGAVRIIRLRARESL
jgi:hypothetical protein